MFSLACRDVGIKDCEYVASGDTEEELWKKGTAHIIEVHGHRGSGYHSTI